MADPRFFNRAGPFTLGHLAGLTGTTLSDPSAAGRVVTDVAPLHDAEAEHLSFLDNRKYAAAFRATRAGGCFVRPEMAALAPAGTVCLIGRNPYKAYALAAQVFYPAPAVTAFRHPSAVIDGTARLGEDCRVEAGAVIGRNVKIGARCVIGAQAVICDGVEIGDDCDIGAQSYITHSLIGSRVRLYPGVCMGRPGFGFAIDLPAGYVSVPQLGRVIVGDDVEIGARCTIDRGAGPDTVIGTGTRIDNLVQIGHNAQLGKFCVMVSQSGIAGSARMGDYVMVGGQAGVAGHISVGAGAKIAGQSGVTRDVPPGGEVMGTPCVPIRKYMRQVALLSRMTGKTGGNDG